MSEHLRTLEHHMERLRYAKCGQTNYDMWDHYGRGVSSEEQRAKMEADFADVNRIYDDAKAAIETLVARLRADKPDVVEAWVDAHDRYLTWLSEYFATRGDESNADTAERERDEWAKVRRGELAVVNERIYYAPETSDAYRELFGFELKP